MIEILQPEINVTPGDVPRTPADRGWVGQGRTVISITNETNRNNSYRLHLECHSSRWKQYWYSFVALPPDNPQQILQNMEDVYGPNNSWVQIYVPQKQTRRIILDVQAERLPEARAGVYPLTIVAKVSIAGTQGGDWVEDATHRLEAVALMRPFYQWKFRVEPETARVGMMRKSRPYEVVLENSGNDWLYCELEPPRLQNVLIDQPPTVRVAVPPPEDNRLPSIRTVPFKASCKKRQFRGMVQDMQIPIVVRRVEAPSVPPLPAAALQGPTSAQYRNAVTYREPDQKDALRAPSDPVLSYHPPLPTTLEGCGKALVQNIKGLIMLIIGLIILVHVWDFMAARLVDQADIKGVELHAKNNQKKYEVEGKYLLKSKVIIIDADTGKDILETIVLPGFDREETRGRYYISLDGVQNRRIRFQTRRKVLLSYLEALIPRNGDPTQKIVVGDPPRSDYSLTVDPFQVGKEFTLLTPGYAADVKLIRVGTTDIRTFRVDGTDRLIATPPTLPPGPVDVAVLDSSGKQLATKSTTISLEPPPTPTATPLDSTGGTAGGADGGGATGGGGSSSGGGSSGGGGGGTASPGATKATSALLKGNSGAAKQEAEKAAADNPGDAEALALVAIADYEAKDEKGGDDALAKASAALSSSNGSRAYVLVDTARAMKVVASNGRADGEFGDILKGFSPGDHVPGLPFLLAIRYFKQSGNTAMVRYTYSLAHQVVMAADEMTAVNEAAKGLASG